MNPIEARYVEDATLKEQRIRHLIDSSTLRGMLECLVRTPVAFGYRAHANFVVSRDKTRVIVKGVDPRSGCVPWRETLWLLPPETHDPVERVTEALIEDPRLADITEADVRFEHGSLRAHINFAAPRNGPAIPKQAIEDLVHSSSAFLGAAIPSRGITVGESTLENKIGNATLGAHYLAFFQSNVRLLPSIVDVVQREIKDASAFLDLYCGVGLHCLLAANSTSQVLGVDNNRWAISSAVENARRMGLSAARFVGETVDKFLRSPTARRATTAFINPTRHGCGPQTLELLAALRVPTICLVSCSIESHLRDIDRLSACGYAPLNLFCFDTFPFSRFLESVTHLRLR